MHAIAALPCATASQLGCHGLHCKEVSGVARSRSTTAVRRFRNVRRGGSLVVVRSKQPDVEQEREELSGFDMPARAGMKVEKKLAIASELGERVERVERVERMFSNLNEVSLKHEPGSLVGSGLLVAEVNVNTMCELGSGGVSLVSMALRTLGDWGVRVACGAYLFIHYALLVAYIARSSDIVTNAVGTPLWVSAVLFTGSLGGLCYFGSQRVIGIVNGGLVVGVLGSFGLLVIVGSAGLDFNSLLQANWVAVPHSIPVIALAFVYQNVVPVVTTSLEGDLPRIRTAVVLGTGIPLLLFLIWNAVILGTTSSLVDASGTVQAISDPLLRLRSASGIVGPTVELFSFLAVATSFIGFVLGLSDFLCDLLKLPGGGHRIPLPYILTLLPPFLMSLTSPEIFYQALDFAGTYGVLVLFGILPAAMAWSERYSGTCLPPSTKPIVPGGRVTLAFFIGAAGFVITSEAISKLFP